MPDTEGHAASARGPLAISKTLTTPLLGVCALFVIGALMAPSSPDRDEGFAALSASVPERILIPSVGVAAAVVPIQVSADRVLDPPNDPEQVGWWDASTQPGEMRGQTVITGHTVHTGGGAMDRIDSVKPGKRIDVVTGNGTMRYRVTDVKVLDKGDVSARAQSLFGQDDGSGRLVLVSCDDWNGSEYESNVVVFGEPLGEPLADSGTA